jgi:hypothetical protein
MAFHKMASGHFAYVINESGNRQLVTEEQFRECCCLEPAPTTCPCSPWLPSEWPCGGLLETYSVSFSITIPFEGNDYTYNGSGNILANSTYSCYWLGTVTLDAVPIDPPDGLDDEVTVSIRLTGGVWQCFMFDAGFLAALGEKATGLTPIGTYSFNASPPIPGAASGTCTVS